MSDAAAYAWSHAPPTFEQPWRPVVVDLDTALPEIDTRGIDALHVTAFVGSTPVGRVVVPTRADTCTAAHLRSYLCRFDLDAFATSLRRQFDEPEPGAVPSATIIVCTRNRAHMLRTCLESLTAQTADIHEIIVVHNFPEDDGTEAVAAEFGIRYRREPDLGIDRARNRGAAEATTDIVLYTDDDVRVDPDWARWLLRPFSDPQIAAVTGLILPGELTTAGQIEFERMAGFVRTFTPFVLDGTTIPPASAGTAGAGASMAFRRSFLLETGGFPDSLDAGQPTATGGDTYALYQALRRGFRVAFEPRSVAFHTHRATPEAALRAVHGYATGVVAYLLEAAIEDRDPAAATAAARWARSRVAVLCRSLIRRPGARSTRYVLTQVAGLAKAPWALRQARAASARLPRILDRSAALATAPPPRLHTDAASPSTSVVIPTHGRRPSLASLVDALRDQVYPGDVEIIVATDGPFADETDLFEMIGGPLDCRVIVGSQGGAGAARNAGAAAAGGELLVFLDDDVLPADEHLLLAHADAHAEGSALVLGPILPVHTDQGALTLATRNWWMDQATRLRTAPELNFTDVCSGNLSIRREAFHALGGFRPLRRQEDYDLGLRAVEAGIALRCAPTGAILHNADTTAHDSLIRRRQEGRGDVLLVTSHPLAAAGLRLGSWDELTGRARRSATLALRWPRVAVWFAHAWARAVAPLNRLGSRWYLDRIQQQLITMAYWAGVGEEAGGIDGWVWVKDSIDHAARSAPIAHLDLSDLGGWSPPPMGTVGTIVVSHHGVVLGEANLGWGGTPFDKRRFGAEVIRRFVVAALQVEAERAIAS